MISLSEATILIVESDVKARHLIAEYLRGCGYKTLEASSSDEAMTVLEQHGAEIEFLLCDVLCPGSWNGFELARKARSLPNAPEILLVAGPDRAVEKVEGLCDDGPHLTRPYHPQTLLNELKRLKAARK